MIENDATMLGMRALLQLLLATADLYFILNIFTLAKQIEVQHRELANKARFALYPWLVILPIHATVCIWHFILYIGAMLGEPLGTVM
jgi:hypothetical protein